MSEREVARQFGLARETVRKMLLYAVRPGYRRQQPVRRPKLRAWIGTIDQILWHSEILEYVPAAGFVSLFAHGSFPLAIR
jgi:hypothetical protein